MFLINFFVAAEPRFSEGLIIKQNSFLDHNSVFVQIRTIFNTFGWLGSCAAEPRFSKDLIIKQNSFLDHNSLFVEIRTIWIFKESE